MAADLTVTQLTQRISAILDQYADFSQTWVCGEISNYKKYPSGHAYFILKDSNAQLNCTLFRGAGAGVRFDVREGMQVRLQGRANLYAGNGKFQFIVTRMELAGQGALYAEYLERKKRFEAEGLFRNRRELPAMPRRVGVVTSPKGAVIQDIRNVSFRRFPGANLLLYPSAVQGEGAGAQLRRGVEVLGAREDIDVIIVARGGGSIEDLWCFNDEGLVRAIAACPKPVISAVGHETDFTLCDFAADKRAPTPSAAAELVWPNAAELILGVRSLEQRLRPALERRVREWQTKVALLSQTYTEEQFGRFLTAKRNRVYPLRLRLEACRPDRMLAKQEHEYKQLAERLENSLARRMETWRWKLTSQAGRLEQLSPLKVLTRGYGLVTDAGGEVLTSVRKLSAGQSLRVELRDGTAHCKVETIEQKQMDRAE